MNKKIVSVLVGALLSGTMSLAVAADGKEISTADGILNITLPSDDWYAIASDEDTEMFSDGDCAIKVNFYKNGDVLPAIESADSKHEMIYTAAASTQDYVMHVVGYAHKQEDFSEICKSINSIHVNSFKVNDDSLKQEVPVASYGIIDANYISYVSADELNVRSTSENGTIIATLSYGTEVTVTGLVTRDGAEIGWARIKMADGTEGYTSTQFLSASKLDSSAAATGTQVDGTSRTGYSITVFDGEYYYYLYDYTDGTVRDDWGNVYVKDGMNTWVRQSDGTVYNTYDPNESGQTEQNMATTVIYSSSGIQKYITCTGIDHFVDSDGVVYNPYAQGMYISENNEIFYTSGSTSIDNLVPEDIDIGNGNLDYGTVLVQDYEGNQFYITKGDRSFWYDSYGNVYDTGHAYGDFLDAYGNHITVVVGDSYFTAPY